MTSTCPYVFKNNSSKNKGSVCGRTIRSGAPFCWQHKTSGLKQLKSEPEPKKIKKVKEVIVDIKTSESETSSESFHNEIEEIKINKAKTTPFTQLKNTPAPKKKKYSSSSSESYSLDSSQGTSSDSSESTSDSSFSD